MRAQQHMYVGKYQSCMVSELRTSTCSEFCSTGQSCYFICMVGVCAPEQRAGLALRAGGRGRSSKVRLRHTHRVCLTGIRCVRNESAIFNHAWPIFTYILMRTRTLARHDSRSATSALAIIAQSPHFVVYVGGGRRSRVWAAALGPCRVPQQPRLYRTVPLSLLPTTQ